MYEMRKIGAKKPGWVSRKTINTQFFESYNAASDPEVKKMLLFLYLTKKTADEFNHDVCWQWTGDQIKADPIFQERVTMRVESELTASVIWAAEDQEELLSKVAFPQNVLDSTTERFKENLDQYDRDTPTKLSPDDEELTDRISVTLLSHKEKFTPQSRCTFQFSSKTVWELELPMVTEALAYLPSFQTYRQTYLAKYAPFNPYTIDTSIISLSYGGVTVPVRYLISSSFEY